MIFYLRIFYLIATFLLLVGCQRLGLSPKISLENDAILIEMQDELTLLEDEIKTMKEEEQKIATFISQPDMDTETERSLTLTTRNNDKIDYSKVITQEEFDYFTNKKIHPLKKGWEDRYRTAVDLNP